MHFPIVHGIMFTLFNLLSLDFDLHKPKFAYLTDDLLLNKALYLPIT